ncbi:MAG: hypothetical protein KVP17_005336 [Porospora cf. gigantea B]|uniref:uncharacterized protein n=1 Tax=Porospora cf. gigantea B TaxID=2853592 RepID=UPI003571E83B|nr:MAG: hypothetical protein KVP17_005336 [Porospora cf. gigantea B]
MRCRRLGDLFARRSREKWTQLDSIRDPSLTDLGTLQSVWAGQTLRQNFGLPLLLSEGSKSVTSWTWPAHGSSVSSETSESSPASISRTTTPSDCSEGWAVQRVICSPLSRCLQTTQAVVQVGALGNLPRPVMVCPLITEQVVTNADLGSRCSVLVHQYDTSLFDFSLAHESEGTFHDWWWGELKPYNFGSHRPVTSVKQWILGAIPLVSASPEPATHAKRRVNAFLHALALEPERCVLIVGHSAFFRLLTRDKKMSNGEIRFYNLHRTTKAVQRNHAAEAHYLAKAPSPEDLANVRVPPEISSLSL